MKKMAGLTMVLILIFASFLIGQNNQIELNTERYPNGLVPLNIKDIDNTDIIITKKETETVRIYGKPRGFLKKEVLIEDNVSSGSIFKVDKYIQTFYSKIVICVYLKQTDKNNSEVFSFTKKWKIPLDNVSTPIKKSSLNDITLDWSTGAMTPYGVLDLENGEQFNVTVQFPDSYQGYEISINGKQPQTEKKPITEGSIMAQGDKPKVKKEFTDSIIHHSDFVSYEVSVTKKKANKGETATRKWVIPVNTIKWTIAFAGGFLGHGKTNPVYYLEPGQFTDTTDPTKTEQGFFVRENKDARDKISIAPTAMIHLYHPRFGRIGRDITLVPISLGIGVDSKLDTKYCLGILGLKFGEELFLNWGVTLVSVDRLPANLDSSDPGKYTEKKSFTTDANALTNLGKKNDWGFFVSLTYSFLGSEAKSKFMQPFTTSTEEAKPDNSGDVNPPRPQEGGSDNEDAKITVSFLDDNKKAIKIEGKDLGKNFGKIKVLLTYKNQSGKEIENEKTQITKIDDNNISFNVPTNIKDKSNIIINPNDVNFDKTQNEIKIKITYPDSKK